MAATYMPPGTRNAPSITDLANLGGFRREYVCAWRREGAPTTLDIREWRDWFLKSGNIKYQRYARKLSPYCLPSDDPTSALEPDELDDGGETKDQADLRWARLRADKMQREVDQMDGRLVDRSLIVLIVSRFAALVSERLQSGVWDDLILAGLPADPELQRKLRAAHDDAIARVRADVTGDAMRAAIRDVLREQGAAR